MDAKFVAFEIFIIIFQIESVVCESSEVIFEIMDGELHQVIFKGEENITLICQVSNVQHADVRINKTAGDSVASNNGSGNCVEYTIPEITEQSDVDYSCMVRYREENTSLIIEMSKSLSLNVKQDLRALCFRNGSMPPEEYREGDTLLLSCYCIDVNRCLWYKKELGASKVQLVNSTFRHENNNKVLLQIVAGPLTSMGVTERYTCVALNNHISSVCSIGPANESIHDLISQHTSLTNNVKRCRRMAIPITETIPEEISSTREELKDSDSSGSDEMKDDHSSTSNKMESTVTNQYQGKSEKEEITTIGDNAEALEDTDFARNDQRDDGFHVYIIIITGIMLSLLIVSLLSFVSFLSENEREKTDKHYDTIPTEKKVKTLQDPEDINGDDSPRYAVPK